MNQFKVFIIVLSILVLPFQALAHIEKSFSAGLGFFSGNSFGKLTKEDVGGTATIGTVDYPLILKFDKKAFSDFFVSSRLSYTLMPRSGSESTVKATTLHLYFPIGKSIQGTNFDWGIGPGLLRRTLKGSGGIAKLNNGNGTADFAMPGRSVDSQTVTMNFASSYNWNRYELGFDLITEGFLSSNERTINAMLSFSYNFMSK